MFSKEKLIHVLIIFFVSIVAIFAHGYQFAVSDQEIFIPYILKSADPSLFPGDLLFKQPSAGASIFYPVVGFLAGIFDLQAIFFTGYLVFQFIFFLGIFRLAKIILGDDKLALGPQSRAHRVTRTASLAYLSLLPFLLPKFIGGTATLTHDVFFGYRSLGLIFFLYYLIYLFENKFLKSATVAALGIWIHPLGIIPNVLLLPAIFFLRPGEKLKNLIKITAIFIIIVLPFLIISKLDFDQSGIDNLLWLSIIRLRDDYLFPSQWKLAGWAAAGLYLVLIFPFLKYLQIKIRKIILAMIVVSLSVFIINLIILDFKQIPSIAQFQLVRSISPLAYIGLVISPILLTLKNSSLKLLGALAFIFLSSNLFTPFLLILIIFLIIMTITKPKIDLAISRRLLYSVLILITLINLLLATFTRRDSRELVQFPKKQNDWIRLQIWVRQNTSKTAIFLVPPNQTGFRIYSQRSIVGDIKDGAVVMYSPNYAKRWFSSMKDLRDYNSLDEERLNSLRQKYQFNYIVITKDKVLNLPIVYQNSTYRLYKI